MSKVPNLVAELLRRGWTDEEVKAALGNNLLRVMSEVEKVRNKCTHARTQTHTHTSNLKLDALHGFMYHLESCVKLGQVGCTHLID